MNSSKKFYQRPSFWVIFIFVYSIVLVRYSKVSIHDEGFGRSWYYGDGFSEKNVESAAKYYRDHGFTVNSGLPMYEYTDSIPGNDYVYTHYPPMAEWIGGLTARITGHYSDRAISMVPLLLSVFLFFLIFHVLSQWLDNDTSAFAGAAVLVLSNYFIVWADDMHQHLYIEFFRWSFVYLWWQYLAKEPRKYLIPALAFCYAMMCLLSYEAYVYTAIIIVGLPWALRKKVIRWEVLVLLLVPVFSFGLRLYLNARYLGGMEVMIADMKGAFLNRTGRSGNVSELQRKMYLVDYLYYLPKTQLHRLGHFYLFPSLLVILLCGIGLIKLRRDNQNTFRLGLVIGIATLSWICVMPQHAFIHLFTLRHYALFIGLFIGVGLLQYRAILIHHWKNRKYLFLAGHLILIFYTMFYIGINTVYFVYLKYGLLYPHLGTGNYELFDHFLL